LTSTTSLRNKSKGKKRGEARELVCKN